MVTYSGDSDAVHMLKRKKYYKLYVPILFYWQFLYDIAEIFSRFFLGGLGNSDFGVNFCV